MLLLMRVRLLLVFLLVELRPLITISKLELQVSVLPLTPL
jgi:hypothetical protein